MKEFHKQLHYVAGLGHLGHLYTFDYQGNNPYNILEGTVSVTQVEWFEERTIAEQRGVLQLCEGSLGLVFEILNSRTD